MPILRVVDGRSTASEFSFEQSVTIGRAESCDVRVFDEAASRRHAEIRRADGGYEAVDLGSANGLFVNGRKVERARLRTGDEIAVRGLTLVFVGEGAAERPTVVEQRLDVESRVSPASAPAPADALDRLAAVYRFASILAQPGAGRRAIAPFLEETFAPCRAALVLPEGDAGGYSRSVVEHARRTREALLVREPAAELPRSASLVAERVVSAMAAPLGDYGALYVDRPRGERFTTRDLELLAALANAATPALRPAPASRPPPASAAQDLLGDSPAMRSLRDEIARVAPVDATVLITGETGTGKELVARALHAGSPRAPRPFVAVNCAAFVETLLEAELFGHEKGAFTGADRARPGRFEQAHGGTLFLDEVGELRPDLQAKLLRVLETREFHRVGAARPTRVDVRIVAATNRDLRGGGFREDLYFRLGVVTLHCPPLRERPGDVRLLAERFLEGRRVAPEAAERLETYAWPGNVRELRNVCERLRVLARGDEIGVDDLPVEVRLGRAPAPGGAVPTLREMERQLVVRALEATGGNRTRAAKLLGITYPTLKKKIDDYGL